MMYVKKAEFTNGDKSSIRVILSSKQVVTVKSYIKEKDSENPIMVASYGKLNDQLVCNSAMIVAGGNIHKHRNMVNLMTETLNVFEELVDLEKTVESLEKEMEKRNYEINPERYF